MPRRALQSPRPLVTEFSSANIGGAAGWRAFGHGQAASEQIGAFDGSPLNQFPVNLPGVQRYCGVEGLQSGWYYPTVTVVPAGASTVQQVQRGSGTSRLAGAQRRGQTFTGPIGPITAKVFRKRVLAASVDQSALSVESWANLAQPGSD